MRRERADVGDSAVGDDLVIDHRQRERDAVFAAHAGRDQVAELRQRVDVAVVANAGDVVEPG